MKKNLIFMIGYAFLGAAIVPLKQAFSNLGKFSSQKEGLLFFIGLLCLAVPIFIFRQYNLSGDKLNPNIKNPRLRKLLIKYPVLIGAFPVVIGAAIGVICLTLLGSD